MTLLIIYVLVAVGFSFLCSIAEAVLLSVSTSYIAAAEQEGKAFGAILRKLKDDINSPLAVILTLNTVAHTAGAAGAGAQAASLFGNVYLGVFSAALTLLILIFSEIIPKALGAHYWRKLAPLTAHTLKFLVRVLYPFVLLSNALTSRLAQEKTLKGFSRSEFAAMAELGEQEGQLNKQESLVLQNLFNLREIRVRSVMTPRTVVFSQPEENSIAEFLAENRSRDFSRVPIYSELDNITGFVLRSDCLIAQSEGKSEVPLKDYRREIAVVLDQSSLLNAFEEFISHKGHIMLVVDEYGSVQGILTLEDILETLLGLEITDENDSVKDMQELARRLGSLRRKKMGLDAIDEPGESEADVNSDNGNQAE